MPRQQRESHQQAEKVRQRDPLLAQMLHESAKAHTFPKTRERQLVDRDDEEPGERDLERVSMKQGNACKRCREDNEVQGNPSDHDAVELRSPSRSAAEREHQ